MKHHRFPSLLAGLSIILAQCTASVCAEPQPNNNLAAAFVKPPESARPWVYWFPLDGNITTAGMTADLEAMKRVGIGGALYMETEQGTPKGKAEFAGPLWRALFKHACAEAARLGLEINMNNDAGWCGSGGPWITPEFSMQKIVYTETQVEGPRTFDDVLTRPEASAGYYRDIAVFAYPTPEGNTRIRNINEKAAYNPVSYTFPDEEPAAIPSENIIPGDRIADLTVRAKDGRLAWEVPAGKWTIVRMGHTSTGKENHPAPKEGRGLECDKLSREAADLHFEGLMGRLIRDVGPLAGKTLVSTHIDSWEIGSQNWTPKFREEFARRAGYEIDRFLPVYTGRFVDSSETSERFLWDLRRVISELILDNYAGRFRELANKHGMRLSIEAYNTCPVDELAYAGRCDEPMGEFWAWPRYSAAFSCTEMASAAHVYGRPIVGAEAFTSDNNERWLGHPGNIKELGDWAFCEGINRFVFHRYALQPWLDVKPGISMGPWGLHYERTQTWWEQSRAWHEYLARCQYLLQQGKNVADILYLMPEGSPQSFNEQKLERIGHNFDLCPSELVLNGMSVKDGRIGLPGGANYRILVLPNYRFMTPQLLRKIADLINAGAIVAGNPPVRSPSLTDYPKCDEELKKLVGELWGSGSIPGSLGERKVGKGMLVSGAKLDAQARDQRSNQVQLTGASWIWHKEKDTPPMAPPEKRYLRRVFDIKSADLKSAQLAMCADNSFECWVNGRKAGDASGWQRAHAMNIKPMLKPGKNVIAVVANNESNAPNPAGLIGLLHVIFADGQTMSIATDGKWESSSKETADWKTVEEPADAWASAVVVGPLGMQPWGDVGSGLPVPKLFPETSVISSILLRHGIPEDFSAGSPADAQKVRYIHRDIDGTDVYFVANKNSNAETMTCAFRAGGRAPELWWPQTGRIERTALFRQDDGSTTLPLRLEAHESVFVVFPKNAGKRGQIVDIAREGKSLFAPTTVTGNLKLKRARYGVLNDPSRTRDMTQKLQALIDEGQYRFSVAKLAEGDDPAFLVVKTLEVEYELDGQARSASATDPETFSFVNSGPADMLPRVEPDKTGGFVIEVQQPGKYELKAAGDKLLKAEIAALPPPLEVSGPWEVRFSPGGGAPEKVTLDKLISWSDHPDAGVKHFSGTATYRKQVTVSEDFIGKGRRLYLDLGRVDVMAEVNLNGKDLGILWNAPYVVDISEAAKPGENDLELRIVNLWVNRMIGDEQLAEDSERKPDGTLKAWPKWIDDGKPSPTGRFTFSSWKLWKKDSPLVESGLIGPVTIRATQTAVVGRAE